MRAESSEATSPRRPARFSTRRRLIAVFAIVLAVFVVSLVLPLAGLRRMETTFGAMQEHEYQELLALQLEEAVRAQYRLAGAFVARERVDLAEYDRARARASEVIDALRARVDEPEAIGWMDEIRQASLALDEIFRDRIEPAVLSGDPAAAAVHEKSYRLVFLIDRNVHRLFARLQDGNGAFRRELQDVEGDALRWTGAFLLGAPILIAAAVLYLSRSVAQPLSRLSEGAAGISRNGLGTRIAIDSPDEFGALAAEFNAMTSALEQQQEKLVESEKLAGIGRLAAGVAHELNNPLQVMLGYLFLHRSVADPELARDLRALEQEAIRCKQIVDGLLELSRPPAARVGVDLGELCEDVAKCLRRSMAPRAVRMSVEGSAATVGEPAKLRQVVFNLVKNAVEASGPDGQVRVELGASGGQVEVTVSDTGPGVPAEDRSRLFEPFFTTKPSGTGLGLAVSQAIALAHGGEVTVRNGQSGGAAFTLRLPPAPGG